MAFFAARATEPSERAKKSAKLEPRKFLGSRPRRLRRVGRPPDRVSVPLRACHAWGRVVGQGGRGVRACGCWGMMRAKRTAAGEITTRHATRAEIARHAERISSYDPGRSRIAETRGRFSRRGALRHGAGRRGNARARDAIAQTRARDYRDMREWTLARAWGAARNRWRAASGVSRTAGAATAWARAEKAFTALRAEVFFMLSFAPATLTLAARAC